LLVCAGWKKKKKKNRENEHSLWIFWKEKIFEKKEIFFVFLQKII
jgi:hypothetical protein